MDDHNRLFIIIYKKIVEYDNQNVLQFFLQLSFEILIEKNR